ncbi:MAG TPA: TrmH family RNA methyltransferase [Bdellovibrionota bacterium]|nr:TrmH family RNA methyltransferase [Bdellovibrionota bacterium]
MKSPVVVLVHPQAYGNLGAVARSMANFGFSELRVVGKVPNPNAGFAAGQEIAQSDWAMATPRGHAILKNLSVYPDLASAVADCAYVVGTSGKKDAYHGGYDRPVSSPEATFAEDHFGEASALVFGPEDDGLSAEDAGHCDVLVHIPTSVEAPSMNLAMAATLIFYSFHLAKLRDEEAGTDRTRPRKQPSRGEASTAGHMESLVRYVLECLQETQFNKTPDAESTRARLRRVLRSWQLNQGDLLFVFEVFYQLKCWGQGKYEERNFLSK